MSKTVNKHIPQSTLDIINKIDWAVVVATGRVAEVEKSLRTYLPMMGLPMKKS